MRNSYSIIQKKLTIGNSKTAKRNAIIIGIIFLHQYKRMKVMLVKIKKMQSLM
jgi:hypothetical protein